MMTKTSDLSPAVKRSAFYDISTSAVARIRSRTYILFLSRTLLSLYPCFPSSRIEKHLKAQFFLLSLAYSPAEMITNWLMSWKFNRFMSENNAFGPKWPKNQPRHYRDTHF